MKRALLVLVLMAGCGPTAEERYATANKILETEQKRWEELKKEVDERRFQLRNNIECVSNPGMPEEVKQEIRPLIPIHKKELEEFQAAESKQRPQYERALKRVDEIRKTLH